jgi:NRAMP (natural resistance-associated macrophage protein)-like metal ion transporter
MEELKKTRGFLPNLSRRLLIILAVFGPATITAMADNDAAGVATYSVAGAKLGYPILFLLAIVTVLLAITQEMGMRLTLHTRKGLADLIREKWGIRVSVFMFICLMIANVGTIISDLIAVKTSFTMLGIPAIPAIVIIVVAIFFFVTKGNYRLTQNIMLIACLFYLMYVVSAIKAQPDWGMALSNMAYPHGVAFNNQYWKDYLIIGMGVLGTTITPWGQFFLSSFAFDKKIDPQKIKYSQAETYWGAFLTDFFSFFMIVATAAALYVHNIPLVSGEQAALAIEPFAGKLAGTLFALGILNAGFMGIVVISLSTAYAFSEFFGISGSLNSDFQQSKTFYIIFTIQLVIAAVVAMFPSASLFTLAIVTQAINAMALPLVFYYLITLTSNKNLMQNFVNKPFQKYFAIVASGFIVIASAFTLIAAFIKF